MRAHLDSVLVCALLLCVWLCVCTAQSAAQEYQLCTLKSGTISYAINGTVSSNGGISSFPPYYTAAYLNFCTPPSQCRGNSYACLTGAPGLPLALCNSRPMGTFLNTSAPQVGASFHCEDNSKYLLNGIVGWALAPHHPHPACRVASPRHGSHLTLCILCCVCPSVAHQRRPTWRCRRRRTEGRCC